MQHARFLVALLLAGCAASVPQVAPVARQGLAFALFGDVPYSQAQANLLDGMIEDMNREQLAFAVHLGDITGGDGPCTDDWLDARRRQFGRIAAPFVLAFGDNEWTDCHRSGFDPLERLARLRALFHAEAPGALPLERQSAAYPEHVRWTAGDVLFVALNVPGSNNNLGRTPAMDAEHRQRMTAVLAWLDASFALAAEHGLAGVTILSQANPDFEGRGRRAGMPDGYRELRAALARHALAFGKPVLYAHGDTHRFRQDQPLADPATGQTIAGFTRVEVDGSPWMSWLRVRFSPRAARPVQIERVLPSR